ncbi:hypothetical protein [Thiohalophilus thiocyanatoxydans]|uniref:Glycosyltransferase involved in cell wall biosynthesis n=1 Tax=Thiohalophilus thiocyanatoxydans TaxID=381308 RepID=A0A4V3H4C8_9GAMM|nr:hypothetical protein [Thiohalophilus thiocyanatoxydans]TDY02685.1 hypothetical protein EDC23_1062 [Thiohalophilus thiocyanatoxydans]
MYIFQKNDTKYRAWSKGLDEYGIETTAITGSPIKAPLLILWMIIKKKPINGYIFRYLNDYPSLPKTIVRLLSELATILLVKIFGGHVIWIAHNVDKESSCHYKTLTNIRRLCIKNAATCIFVTDPLLLKYAQKEISDTKNIDWTCFGRPSDLPVNRETLKVQDAIRSLRYKLELNNPEKKVYIGLCVSSPSTKCIHFLTVSNFVDRYNHAGVIVGVVVVGAIGLIHDERFQWARNEIINHEHIVLLDETISVREQYLKNDIDFFYRALDDLSVSYSVYVSASIRKPIVTEEGTFLAEMIDCYELGGVSPLKSSCENENWLETLLKSWQPEKSEKFLDDRNWNVAAAQLISAIKGRE